MSNLYSLLVLNDLIHLGFESFDLEPDKGYPNQGVEYNASIRD